MPFERFALMQSIGDFQARMTSNTRDTDYRSARQDAQHHIHNGNQAYQNRIWPAFQSVLDHQIGQAHGCRSSAAVNIGVIGVNH